MDSCCTVRSTEAGAPTACPSCGKAGRKVERITLKALLRSEALARMTAPEHRFCPSAGCPVVYFGQGEIFGRDDLNVPVFQKEPRGHRTVCYCFAVSEGDLRDEIAATGRSMATERITDLVTAGRCACEVRNPQGSCCLGNVAMAVKAAQEAVRSNDKPLTVIEESPRHASAPRPRGSAGRTALAGSERDGPELRDRREAQGPSPDRAAFSD